MTRMAWSRFLEVMIGALAMALGIVLAVAAVAVFLIGLAVVTDLIAGVVR